MVKQANNQRRVVELAQDQRCFCVAFEKKSIKNVAIPTCVGSPSTKLISDNRGGLENIQPRVVKLEYHAVLNEKEKCQSRHVLLHKKKWDGHPIRNE
jgi:hypothetical protein